jgi:hypothetical protein
MRPKINRGGELRDHVADYAKDNGLSVPEAWHQLVRRGLTAEGYLTNDSEQ